MEWSRLVSLLIVVLYIICLIYTLIIGIRNDELSRRDIFEGFIGTIFWLVISIGLIWFGDELGDGLRGARYGLITESSPGWAVKLMGWVFLLLPGILFFIYLIGNYI
jgi:hypothetical protein